MGISDFGASIVHAIEAAFVQAKLDPTALGSILIRDLMAGKTAVAILSDVIDAVPGMIGDPTAKAAVIAILNAYKMFAAAQPTATV